MIFLKLKDTKIRTRLWAWSGLTIVFIVIMGVVGAIYASKLEEAVKRVVVESEEMHMVDALGAALARAIQPPNDYLVLGGDPREPENFEKRSREVEEAFTMLETNRHLQSPEETTYRNLFEAVRSHYAVMKQKNLQIFAIPQEVALQSSEAGQLMEQADASYDRAVETLDEWRMGIGEETDIAIANTMRVNRTLLAIEISLSAFLAMLSIILAWIFTRSITAPVSNLVRTTQRVSTGDLNARAEVASKDEIGQLATSFNQMTDSLLEARKFPENIIRSMTESLIVVTPEAKIKEVNQATLDLLGYERGELLGQPIEKVFGRAAAAAAAAAETIFRGAGLEKLIKEGFVKDVEMTYRIKKGKEIPVNVSGSVMKDEKGKMVGIVIVAKDMKVYKEFEEQRVAAAAAAVATEKYKRELAEKTSNEIAQKVIERDAANQQLRASNQQVNAANQQLAAMQKNLQDKLLELERFNKVAVGRELKMVELKEEIARLKGKT